MVFIQRDVPSPADLKPFNMEQAATEKTSETELLQMSASCTMKGISLQIAKLSTLAADVFLSLAKEAKESKKNLVDLTARVKNVSKLVPAIDDYLREIPRDQIFKRKGIELSIEMNEKEQLFSAATRTAQLSELIDSTLPPPHLELLDYDSSESESCLLKYSNPLFFFNVWLKKMKEQEEVEQRLRRERREKNRARKKEKLRPVKLVNAVQSQSFSPSQRSTKESVNMFELVLETRARLSANAPQQKAPLSEKFGFAEKDYVPNVPVPKKRSLECFVDIAPRQRCASDEPSSVLSLSEQQYQEHIQPVNDTHFEEELAMYKEKDKKNKEELIRLRKELEEEKAKKKVDRTYVAEVKVDKPKDESESEDEETEEKTQKQQKNLNAETDAVQDLSATVPVAPPPPPAPPVPVAPPAPIALTVPKKSVAQEQTKVIDELPPQTQGRKDLLSAIASSSSAKLRHVEPQKKVDPHASLLDSIRGGIVLKKVEKVEKKPQVMPTSVAAILARRIAIQESDSEETDSESWSD